MTQNLPKGMAEMGVRTVDQIRDAHLRDLRNAAVSNGRPMPDTAPGSFEFIRSTALANHLALIEANGLTVNEQLGDDTAVGADLERRAGLYGIFRRAKAGSVGLIVLAGSQPTPVAAGQQLVSTTGIRYAVTTGGLFDPLPANGNNLIEVAAIDAGDATNLPEGDVLQWVQAPPYADPKASVGPGGLVNGVEDETDDELRARYLDHRRAPPTESNHQAMVERAEKASASVQKAFVYMALLGPSTYALAVAAAPTATSKSREVKQITVDNIVAPAVAGTHFDSVYAKIVSVVDEEVEHLSIGLALPAARSAVTPGPGGGWVNGQPWPPAEVAYGYRAEVGAVVTAAEFFVTCDAEPIDGVSRISWLSPENLAAPKSSWTLFTATVVSHSGTPGNWGIVIDRPFTGITASCLIWPAAERQEAYVKAILEAFALMGPGEMSDQPPVLKRSARYPLPSSSWPYSLGASQLRRLSDAGDEVLAARYLGAPTISTPTVDGTAPRILTPKHIGLYPNPT